MRVAPCLALVLGCTPSAPAPTSASTTAPSVSAAPTASAPAKAAPNAKEVFARACATDCADDLADLTVYRDDAGAIGVVTVQGTPMRCSHPPLRFIGPDGAERAVIPLVPVAPGSPEAKKYADLREAQVGKLHKAETLTCRDAK